MKEAPKQFIDSKAYLASLPDKTARDIIAVMGVERLLRNSIKACPKREMYYEAFAAAANRAICSDDSDYFDAIAEHISILEEVFSQNQDPLAF